MWFHVTVRLYISKWFHVTIFQCFRVTMRLYNTSKSFFTGTTPDSPGGWSFHPDRLQQAKSDFGFVRISDMLEDPNC